MCGITGVYNFNGSPVPVELIKKMNDEEWILFFEHDPIYQACTINFDGKHYYMNKQVIISE